jgi:hypothetical protein
MSGMKVVFGRETSQLASLFAGQAWMGAAEFWAVNEGDLVIQQWRVDQRFRIGQQWYRVDWVDSPTAERFGQWVITPLED